MNSAIVRMLLVRGMLAGLAAGLLAFGLARLIGEPGVNAGIAYEDAHTHEHEAEIVSRAMQSTAGLATAVLVFGTAVGGIAALAFCFALGRVGRFGARATAALVAGSAFVTVYLVPFLKYPANPPGANDPDTIGKRTTLYFGMIALAVLLGIAAVILGRRLAARYGNWNATVAAGTAFIVVVSVVMAVLPAVDEVPKDFPAGTLWQFRMASIGIQALLWASFGVIFGFLARRVLHPQADRTARGAASKTPTVV
ncbi:CbtA family protein [Streptomyces sp. S.PNR 29]|uniref:CbtA family protein n=1 Tax=Streptomyces sp. S.PNR 29 TaxID=2973805 RepID=UPI0025B15D01|nr:CbtA family protein [Streptomyces sp. S.PNR 29]MDN0197371.1 CbtA family protein [Streptomyces sp. S.PNR 29]